jgi:hypothetical protein
MSTPTSKKRRKPGSSADEGHADDVEDSESERRRYRLRSEYSEAEPLQTDAGWDSSSDSCPPLSGYELDRLNHHITLQDFGKGLQKAANAVFSSDRRSRYNKVSVLLLSWEDEDPELPVSLEIAALKDVFVDLYGFQVEEWLIPPQHSHMKLNMRVLNFLEDSSSRHLKIAYYAGHGKLSNHGQMLWTRLANNCFWLRT